MINNRVTRLSKRKRHVIQNYISALEDRNLNNRNKFSSSKLVPTTSISNNSNKLLDMPSIAVDEITINANSNVMQEDISNNWEDVSNNWEDQFFNNIEVAEEESNNNKLFVEEEIKADLEEDDNYSEECGSNIELFEMVRGVTGNDDEWESDESDEEFIDPNKPLEILNLQEIINESIINAYRKQLPNDAKNPSLIRIGIHPEENTKERLAKDLQDWFNKENISNEGIKSFIYFFINHFFIN